MTEAIETIRRYLKKRGFERIRIEPIPGTGAAAGGIDLGIFLKLGAFALKGIKVAVKVAQVLKSRRNEWAVNERRVAGVAHIIYRPDPGVDPLGLLIQLEGLDGIWQDTFPGTHLDVRLNMTDSRGSGSSGKKSASVNLRASEISTPILAAIVKDFDKRDSGEVVYEMQGGKIFGKRRLRKNVLPEDLSHKYWKKIHRKQMMWSRV